MLWTGDPGVGQMLTTAMFILISLNSVSDTAQNTLDAQLEARCKFEVHDIITCENERLNLQCPDDHSLLLTSIAFGRTDLYQCPHPSIKSTDCSSDTAPGIVRGECDGKNACSFEATTRFLNGDPCGGTFKYLNVSYTCLGEPCTDNCFGRSSPTAGAIWTNAGSNGTFPVYQICCMSSRSRIECAALCQRHASSCTTFTYDDISCCFYSFPLVVD